MINSIKKLFFSSVVLLGLNVNAQLLPGTQAPDFTVTDINGVSHNLYTYLDAGKTVYLEVFATWCGPCWAYQNTNAMEDLWTAHGPIGQNGVSSTSTNDVIVLQIETDGNTNQSDLIGTGVQTQGNWTTGTHPIIDLTLTEADNFNLEYLISYFPTVYKVCANRAIKEIFQPTTEAMYNEVGVCLNDMQNAQVLTGYVIPTPVSQEGQCNGSIIINVNGGTMPYTYLYQNNNGEPTTQISGLCSGEYQMSVTDAVGVTINLDFVISTPATTYNNGNYTDSSIIDSNYIQAMINCEINYNAIDSTYISSFVIASNDSVLVTWAVVFNDSIQFVDAYYGLDGATGVYLLTLELYCSTKSLDHFLFATDKIYYNSAYATIKEQIKSSPQIYPNPFTDNIVIVLDNDQTSEVIITDITGKEVYKSLMNSTKKSIDLANLSEGQYLVTVLTSSSVMYTKIMK